MKEAIQVAIAANIPVLIWGEPGTGKTSFIQQLARDNKVHLETIISSLRDPTDFGGLPIKAGEDKVNYAAPSWGWRLLDAAKKDGQSWCFMDEITTAPPAVQAALLRVINEKHLGELQLPDNVRMIAAANPPDQAAGGNELAAPLANRFVHFYWSVSPVEWADAMVQGFPSTKITKLPEKWTTGLPGTRALVGSFIRTKGQLLQQLPKDDSKASGPWPSARTWHMASILLAAAKAARAGKEVENTLLMGAVGDGPAMEFVAWLKAQDLPDPEKLLKDPDSFELPDRSDKVYTVLSSVAAAVIGETTPERYMAAWKILATAAEQGSDDVGAAAARTLAGIAKPEYGDLTKYIKPFIPMLQKAGFIDA